MDRRCSRQAWRSSCAGINRVDHGLIWREHFRGHLARRCGRVRIQRESRLGQDTLAFWKHVDWGHRRWQDRLRRHCALHVLRRICRCSDVRLQVHALAGGELLQRLRLCEVITRRHQRCRAATMGLLHERLRTHGHNVKEIAQQQCWRGHGQLSAQSDAQIFAHTLKQHVTHRARTGTGCVNFGQLQQGVGLHRHIVHVHRIGQFQLLTVGKQVVAVNQFVFLAHALDFNKGERKAVMRFETRK